MAFWKRPEVVCLVVLAVGIVGFILLNEQGKTRTDLPGIDASAAPEAVQLEGITLTRDYGNARLDLEITVKNEADTPLTFLIPDTLLATDQGAAIDPFILAFSQPKPLPPDKSGKRTLSYWLEQKHLDQGLQLRIGGLELKVKSSSPFALDSIENRSSIRFNSPVWSSTTAS